MAIRTFFTKLKDQGGIVFNNFIVVACAILIAVNVGVFIFTPKILAPLALILSNVITVILMVAAFIPINRIRQSVIKKNEEEIYQRKKEEEELQEKVSALENKTRQLSSCLNTWGQIASAPMEMVYKRELVIGHPTFDNYVVKEVPLESLLKDPQFKPKAPEGFWEKLGSVFDIFRSSKEETVLYMERHRDKRSIGIDLDKVRIAKDGDKIAIFGATISELTKDRTEESPEDVFHCWVLSKDKKKAVSIDTSDTYADIPALYAQACREEVESGFDKQYELLCKKKTETLRNLISEHVPGVVFYDSIDGTSAPWLSLRDNINDPKIYPVISSINLICNLISNSESNI